MWNSLRSKADIVKQKRKAALTCLAKGYIRKAVSLLNSQWVADTQDPAVMEALRCLRRPFPPTALRHWERSAPEACTAGLFLENTNYFYEIKDFRSMNSLESHI